MKNRGEKRNKKSKQEILHILPFFLFLSPGEEDSELEESQETTTKETDFKLNIAPEIG